MSHKHSGEDQSQLQHQSPDMQVKTRYINSTRSTSSNTTLASQRMYLWWSLCTLYLLTCQVRTTVGKLGLCCCVCATSFKPLFVDSAVCFVVSDFDTQPPPPPHPRCFCLSVAVALVLYVCKTETVLNAHQLSICSFVSVPWRGSRFWTPPLLSLKGSSNTPQHTQEIVVRMHKTHWWIWCYRHTALKCFSFHKWLTLWNQIQPEEFFAHMHTCLKLNCFHITWQNHLAAFFVTNDHLMCIVAVRTGEIPVLSWCSVIFMKVNQIDSE